jgi:protoporphyrinogen oxidase
MSAKRRAVIIGAGPAGLTAAYQFLKTIPDAEVTVFEETGRTGGISTTIEYHGNRIDIGGHRFFSKSKIVNDLWQELMPLQGRPAKDGLLLRTQKEYAAGGPDPEQEDRVMLIRRRVSRIFYRRKFFDYPISIKGATFINMGLVNTVKAGFSYVYSSIRKRPENSLEDFYINRFGKQLYQMFFEDYTEKVWGVHPSKLSASWGAQRVKELSILGILKDALLKIFVRGYKTNSASLIENFIYPKKGPGQLWEIMAEKTGALGGTIVYHARVTGIICEDAAVTAVVVEHGGKTETVPCDYLFSSMPVKDLVAAMAAAGAPAPPAVQGIASALPYRDFITVGLLVKKLKLKNGTRLATVSNIVPDCWIYIQERDVKIGRLQIFNNWSPYMAADFENTVWLGLEYFCNEGDALWSMSEDEFIGFAVDELVKINIIDADDVLDATQVKIKKTYPAYFGAYREFENVRAFLDGFTNLYCIGRNGQHRYNNMDHSMLTAIEAVNLVKSGGRDKRAVWDVNTEEEYHEGK